MSGAPAYAQSGAFADTTSLASRALGITVAASGGPRDTLGLLVAVVMRDGPADQAGITSGSRILAINGKMVRLEPNEIGQRAAADTAMTRFERAVRASASGTDVLLRVAGGGRTRTVSLPIRMVATWPPSDNAPPTSPFGLRAPADFPVAATPAPAMPAAAIEPLAAPVVRPEVSPPATTPALATATPVAGPSVASVVTLDTLAGRLGEVQLALRKAARETHSIALSDSLTDLDQAIAQVRRRLRALVPESNTHVRTDSVSASRLPAPPVTAAVPTVVAPSVISAAVSPTSAASASTTPVSSAATPGAPGKIVAGGLELTRVTADLAVYLGAMADSALLVVKASDDWEPLKVGDVLLQVDGAAPEPARLRAAVEAHTPMRVLVLRRGRTFTLSFGETPAK